MIRFFTNYFGKKYYRKMQCNDEIKSKARHFGKEKEKIWQCSVIQSQASEVIHNCFKPFQQCDLPFCNQKFLLCASHASKMILDTVIRSTWSLLTGNLKADEYAIFTIPRVLCKGWGLMLNVLAKITTSKRLCQFHEHS